MEIINVKAYLIGETVNLRRVARYFNRRLENSSFLMLREEELAPILKVARKERLVYLFPYGCVVFAGFKEIEIRNFLWFLESLGQRVKGEEFLKYVEEYTLVVDPTAAEPFFSLDHGIVPDRPMDYLSVLAAVLASSLFYAKTEDQAGELFDRSEILLRRMRKGHFGISRVYLKNIGRFLEFQLRSAYYFNPVKYAHTLNRGGFCKELYRQLVRVYGLEERHEAVRRKIENLCQTIDSFNELSYQRQEINVYRLQAILIFSFVIMDLIYYFR